jgi:hypothetical protein
LAVLTLADGHPGAWAEALKLSGSLPGNLFLKHLMVLERKAREVQAIQDVVHNAGHQVCYVIDGAGNINVRQAAIRTICQYSDCTVAFSESEIAHLARFMRLQAGEIT